MEETITLPLRFFKELCLGYRYTTYDGKEADNLRDKCVLRAEVTEIIRNTPNYEKYFHIQSTGKDTLPLVWDIREWKDAGERKAERNEKLDKEKERADKLTKLLHTKMPFLDGNALRHLALQYIHNNTDLSHFGIKKEEYEEG